MLMDITKLKDSICNLTNPFDYFIFLFFFLPGNVVPCIDNIVLVRVGQTSQEMTRTRLVIY